MNLFLQPEGCMTIRLINLSKLAAPALLSPHHRVILPGTSLSAVFVSRTDCDSLSRYRIEEAILRARRASNLMHLSACITVDTEVETFTSSPVSYNTATTRASAGISEGRFMPYNRTHISI